MRGEGGGGKAGQLTAGVEGGSHGEAERAEENPAVVLVVHHQLYGRANFCQHTILVWHAHRVLCEEETQIYSRSAQL